jgi:hypothetical protein
MYTEIFFNLGKIARNDQNIIHVCSKKDTQQLDNGGIYFLDMS